MREPKIINHPDMKVILRKDFYEIFMDQLNKITHDTGATYFGHNIFIVFLYRFIGCCFYSK